MLPRGAMMHGLGTKELEANATRALAELRQLRVETTDSETVWAVLIGILRILARVACTFANIVLCHRMKS